MAIELARTHAMPRPWGVCDLRPWNKSYNDGTLTGEIWYERPGKPSSDPSLLLKVLLTSQPLSIQVHPDDAWARSMGLPNGKSEAWYVLSAAPGATVAIGLKQYKTPQQLRSAIGDGSVAGLVAWQAVSANDVIAVPAGTIHAIGAGLVIAEIQQRSDATFRLFDHGRQRELHVENAIAVAKTGPAEFQTHPRRLTDERTLLASNSHFAFERIELAPGTTWCLEAERETWLLILEGGAITGSFGVAQGDAIFAQSDRIYIRAGKFGLVALVAYAGSGQVQNLLRRLRHRGSLDTQRPQHMQSLRLLNHTPAPLAAERMETIQ